RKVSHRGRHAFCELSDGCPKLGCTPLLIGLLPDRVVQSPLSISEAKDYADLFGLTQTLKRFEGIHVGWPKEFPVRLVHALTFVRESSAILASVNTSVPKLAVIIKGQKFRE